MSKYPLLTKVLADATTKAWEYGGVDVSRAWREEQASGLVAAIDPDIADRLERALDVCGHIGPLGLCGDREDSTIHDWPGRVSAHHPYVPLVQP